MISRKFIGNISIDFYVWHIFPFYKGQYRVKYLLNQNKAQFAADNKSLPKVVCNYYCFPDAYMTFHFHGALQNNRIFVVHQLIRVRLKYLWKNQLVIFEKYRDGSIELKNIFHAIHQRLIDIYMDTKFTICPSDYDLICKNATTHSPEIINLDWK